MEGAQDVIWEDIDRLANSESEYERRCSLLEGVRQIENSLKDARIPVDAGLPPAVRAGGNAFELPDRVVERAIEAIKTRNHTAHGSLYPSKTGAIEAIGWMRDFCRFLLSAVRAREEAQKAKEAQESEEPRREAEWVAHTEETRPKDGRALIEAAKHRIEMARKEREQDEVARVQAVEKEKARQEAARRAEEQRLEDEAERRRPSDLEILRLEERAAAERAQRAEAAERQLWTVVRNGPRRRPDRRAGWSLAFLRKGDRLPLVVFLLFGVVLLGVAWVFYLERSAATKASSTISLLAQKISDRRKGRCENALCLVAADYPVELISAACQVLKMRGLDPLSELGHELELVGRNGLREDVLGPFLGPRLRERISEARAAALLLQNKRYIGGCVGAECASERILKKEIGKLDTAERYVLATMTSVHFPLSTEEEDDILGTVLTPLTKEHPELGERLLSIVSMIPWR